MARISTYSLDTYISDNDKLLGVDAENNDTTKNFLIGDLTGYIKTTISLQDVLNVGNTATQDINLTGEIDVTAIRVNSLTVGGISEFNGYVTFSNNGVFYGDVSFDGFTDFTQAVSFNDNVTFYNPVEFMDRAEFGGTVVDGQGNVGTAGQVLSSTGSEVRWSDSGTVTGIGTTFKLPLWSDGPNGALGDSQITQTKIDGGTVFDLNAVTTTNYTPAINTRLLDLNSGGSPKFSITQDGGGGVVLPAGGGVTNPGPSFNLGGTAFSNGKNALAVGAATTAFGNGSFAANFLTLASGGGSSAFGLLTEASALASVSFGNKSIASGDYSIASGQDSIASGPSSVAIGEKGDAQGKNTFVQGFGGTAIGNNSAKFGYAGSAGGNNSVKFGFESVASGDTSFASGRQTAAIGLYSFTAGDGNTAFGERTAAFGKNNNVVGKGSFSIGTENTVDSENSFVGGVNNTLTGASVGVQGAQTSFVFGDSNIVQGLYSTVLGSNNDTGQSTSESYSNNIIIIGHSNTNSTGSSSSVLIGNNNTSVFNGGSFTIGGHNNNNFSSNSLVFGRFNTIFGCTSSMIIGSFNEIDGLLSSTSKVSLIGNGLKFNASGPNNNYGRATYVGYYNNDNDAFSQFQIGNGTNDLNRKNALSISKDSQIKIPEYGLGTVTGTAAYNLSVAADGKIIETVNPYAPDYLSFVCLLSQSGATNPQPNIVLENTLAVANPYTAFTRVSLGEYNLYAIGKFKLLKTIVFINGGSAENNHDIAWEVIDSNNLRIRTHSSDGKLTMASLEIRTYN